MNLKKVEKPETNTVEMLIEVGREEFEKACGSAFKKNAGKFYVPGFRKGKAPRKMIEKMYGEGVFYEDAINISYLAAYDDAIAESGFDPVGKAEFEILDVSAEGYSFNVKVVVSPEVTIGQYMGLTAYKPEVTVSDEEIQEKLNELLEKNARIQTTERPAALNDTVVIDFEGFIDDEAFQGGSLTDYQLKLGSNTFIPGFETQLVGIMAGESRDIIVNFPEDYHAESLQGKSATFKVLCHEVKEEILPEADDEFAKDVSTYDTLDEFKLSIRDNILSVKDEEASAVFQNHVMTELIKTLEAEIPEVMIEDKEKEIFENLRYEMTLRGVSMENYIKASGKTEEDFIAEGREPAIRQLKMALALEKVALLENVSPTEEDITKAQEDFALRMRITTQQAKSYYPDRMARKDLLCTKALDLVMAAAIPTDVQPEEPESEESAE